MSDATTTAHDTHAVLLALADVLDQAADQDGAPTPCTEFSVADLRKHVVGWSTAFGKGFCDKDGQCPDHESVTVAGTGAEQVRAAAQDIVDGIAGGGAERPLVLADGNAMPGDMALGMILWEYQVHGWDLARATGQDWAPDQEPVERSLVFADQMLTPDFQGEGKSFAPRQPVADDAPAIDKLVAMSGRDPGWTA